MIFFNGKAIHLISTQHSMHEDKTERTKTHKDTRTEGGGIKRLEEHLKAGKCLVMSRFGGVVRVVLISEQLMQYI